MHRFSSTRADKVIWFAVLSGWTLSATALAALATGEDAFYNFRIDQLKISAGSLLPIIDEKKVEREHLLGLRSAPPRVVIDGGHEAYLDWTDSAHKPTNFMDPKGHGRLAVRMPAAGPVAGTLFWPSEDLSGQV